LVDTPSLPHGGAEAEDRHSNFYDTWVNLHVGAVGGKQRSERERETVCPTQHHSRCGKEDLGVETGGDT
jgi:hypothetical protein